MRTEMNKVANLKWRNGPNGNEKAEIVARVSRSLWSVGKTNESETNDGRRKLTLDEDVEDFQGWW